MVVSEPSQHIDTGAAKLAPVRRSCLIGLVIFGALAGCGASEPDVVVATMPATAKPYPETPDGTRGAAAPHQFDARRLIGHEVEQAQRIAARFGCTIRITGGDDAPDALTADYDPRRIDITARRGIVTRLQ